MVKEYKKATESVSIGSTFDSELVNKLNDYSKLTGVNRTKLVSRLIAKELEGKVLNNKYIRLDKPLYFNYKELLEKGTVECSSTKPVTNIKDTYIIKNVPNNLDKIIKNKNSYGFENNPDVHKGIIFSSDDHYKEKPKYLVFELNKNRDSFIYEPEIILKISILELNDLTTYLDIDKNKCLINNLQGEKDLFLKVCKDRECFVEEHELVYDKNYEFFAGILSDEDTETWTKITFYVYIFMFKNFNYFIPLKLYSDLQNIILLSDKMDKESFKNMMVETHNTKLTKQDFEEFITTFEVPLKSTAGFFIFFIEFNKEMNQNSFNSFINDYLIEEDVADLINSSELMLN